MAHTITRKGECRLGRVQVEDWTKVYPGITYYTVALYATLQANPRQSYFLRGGERARISYDYETEAEANAAFDFLMDGGDPHELGKPSMSQYWTDWDTEHCIPH